MKTNFSLSCVFGSVYNQGNIVFSPNGLSVYSPISNKVSVFDLAASKACTLKAENTANISVIALNPKGNLLFCCDLDGASVLINTRVHSVIATHFFKHKISDAKFSPDGKYILVSQGLIAQVWHCPGIIPEFAPFVLFRKFPGHSDNIVQVSWASDSSKFITCSSDTQARVHFLDNKINPMLLSGHKSTVINAWFNDQTIYSVSYDGSFYHWTESEEFEANGHLDLQNKRTNSKKPSVKRMRVISRQYFCQNDGRLSCADYKTNLLVCGFTNGVFGIYRISDHVLENIHSLSLGQFPITTISLNEDGEWLSCGSAELGQLVVWEWKSETYILKQQGHSYDIKSLAYSPQGILASGGDDSKIKLWNDSGISFVTFNQHSGPVESLVFAKNGRVLFSASLDGTVRAFDLLRYRNFKTFTSPTPTQFSALAVDALAEIVAAGTQDSYEIYIWSVATGKLLEVLSGHNGPVSGLAFAGSQLISGSWDKTLRIWNVFERNLGNFEFMNSHEILSIAIKPDDRAAACSTLDGTITVWDLRDGKEIAQIDGKRDIVGGRKITDLVTAAKSGSGGYFTSIIYSADGECILASGVSKYVCLYHVASRTLLRRFEISKNYHLDGLKHKLNSRRMTEAGSLDVIEDNITSDEDNEITKILVSKKKLGKLGRIPGATRGDVSERRVRKQHKASCIRFAPTGRSWAVATTEGILIYSLDSAAILFDPSDLDIDVTPQRIEEELEKGEFQLCLKLSLRLCEESIVRKVFEAVPKQQIQLICESLQSQELYKFISFLAKFAANSVNVEHIASWSRILFEAHASRLHLNSRECSSDMRLLSKTLTQWQNDITKLCDENRWLIEFIQESTESTAVFTQS